MHTLMLPYILLKLAGRQPAALPQDLPVESVKFGLGEIIKSSRTAHETTLL